MSTSTVKQLLERLCDDYGIGRYGTNTSADTALITADATFGGAAGAVGIDAGCSVYITFDDGAGKAPEDEETRLSTKPKLSTGVMNLDPAITALANGDKFMVAYSPITFKLGSGPHSIFARLDQVLKKFGREKRIVPITLVPDGDMLASAVADWTDTTAVSAKSTAAFPNGMRAITVTDQGGGSSAEYTSSGNIAVEENTSYYLEVTAWGDDASDAGTLVAYDVTNGAAITLAQYVVDRIEPERFVNNITTPSGCEQIALRLTCTNASDVVNWANLIFRKNEATEFVLADRPQKVDSIGRLLVPSGDTWATRSSWTEVPSDLEQVGAGLWRIRAKESVSGQSLWYEEFLAPATLSTAAGTTTIPVEHLAAAVAESLLFPLRFMSKDWAAKYEYAKERAAGVFDAYQSHNETVVSKTQRVYPLVSV